jgi:hypothetical protein
MVGSLYEVESCRGCSWDVSARSYPKGAWNGTENSLRRTGRIYPGCFEIKPGVQSIPSDKVQRKRQKKSRSSPAQRTISIASLGRSSKEPRMDTDFPANPSTIGRCRSVPGEYSGHHLVHRAEGSTNLVVLFAVIVVLVSILDRENLLRWDPTRFLLPFVGFDVSLDLNIAGLVLSRMLVLQNKCLTNCSTYYFGFLGSNITQLEGTIGVLSGRQLSLLCDTSGTRPPSLSEPTFRAQPIRIRHSLPLTSNNNNGSILELISHSRSPHSRVMTPVSASRDLFSAITAFLTGAPFPFRMFGLGSATSSG